MKHKLLVVFVALTVLAWAPAFAGGGGGGGDVDNSIHNTATGGTGIGVGIGVGIVAPGAVSPTISPVISPTISPKITNSQGQIQGQSQSSKQQQQQGQANDQTIAPVQSVAIENPREYIIVPQAPVMTPQLISGAVSDATAILFPRHKVLRPITAQDEWRDVLAFKSEGGGKMRLEDVPKMLLITHKEAIDGFIAKHRAINPEDVKYSIWQKPGSKGSSIGVGTSGVASGSSSTGFGGMMALGVGGAQSTFDPAFVIFWWLTGDPIPVKAEIKTIKTADPGKVKPGEIFKF